MMYSMTGFGRSQSEQDGLSLTVEIASVNRRNLEVSVSLPREWQSLERDLQALVRERITRGKLNISIQVSFTGSASGFQWDEAGLESSLERLSKVAQRHGIGWPPDANALVRLAAQNKAETVLPALEQASVQVADAVQTALDDLMDMRSKEGEALKTDLLMRLSRLVEAHALIGNLAEGTVTRYRDVLLQRLRQLDLDLDFSDERFLKEVALFADRCDTSEEQTRLESHFQQFGDCLEDGSPVGRKLEFILQEMNREFNTIGSKANNIEVNRQVIEAKNEIERIREQIQNVE